jgi:DNA-binding LytR/AlgR family response regulator
MGLSFHFEPPMLYYFYHMLEWGGKMELRIAICDDTDADRELLYQHLRCCQFKNNDELIIDQFSSGRQLLASHDKSPYHIVFLDIEMPAMDGIQLAGLLRTQKEDHTFIVFTTSYPEYMHDSFDVQPFQYLIKPVSLETVEKLLYKIRQKIEQSSYATLLIDEYGEEHLVPLNKILYISSMKTRKRYVLFHLTDQTLTGKATLSQLEELLAPQGFASPSRGILLNIRHIKSLNGDRVILKNSEARPVSRRRARALQTQYANHIIQIMN